MKQALSSTLHGHTSRLTDSPFPCALLLPPFPWLLRVRQRPQTQPARLRLALPLTKFQFVEAFSCHVYIWLKKCAEVALLLFSQVN
jgi:hypothetical protein